MIMDTARIHFSNRDILLLFLPIAGELLLHYTVGIVDSIMVASVGEAAVSGVSLMDFVISFFNSLLTALAVGGTVVIGQYLGNVDRLRAADAAVQMVLLMALAGTLLALAAYALQPFITGRLFGDLAPDVRRHADVYFGILAASLPFMGVYSAGAAVTAGMTVCPNCKTQISAGSKFCNHCGTKLDNLCPNCGATIVQGSVFCAECGHKL